MTEAAVVGFVMAVVVVGLVVAAAVVTTIIIIRIKISMMLIKGMRDYNHSDDR